MPIPSRDGESEFISSCEFHAKEAPSKLVEGEVIMISKLNETARKVVHTLECEYEQGDPPSKCGNKAVFYIERGFPIQD